jgi:Xaa-Pro aminopeptidase
VYDAIGKGAVAILQGAPTPDGYTRFRQSADFYYLCGVEVPNAYLVLDGASRKTVLYLPHRNEGRERGEGKVLSAEDAEEVRKLSGVDEVAGTDLLGEHLARTLQRRAPLTAYTPLFPPEGSAESRDLALRRVAELASDPWDGRPSRAGNFVARLRERLPNLAIADLSPALDTLRLIKSPREIALIRRATRLSGLALIEGMRSTKPGQYEHELDGLGKFIYYRNGAQGDAYYSLIASGRNAWYPHYNAGKRRMEDGDFLLMDYAPDYGYYMSDVTRMWPVNGKFSDWQRELYGFYLSCYRAILKAIRPGALPSAIMLEAAGEMDRALARAKFSKDIYRKAGGGVRQGLPRGGRTARSVARPLGRDGDARRRPAHGPVETRDGLHDRARAAGAGREDLRAPGRPDRHRRQIRRDRQRLRPLRPRRHRKADEGARPPSLPPPNSTLTSSCFSSSLVILSGSLVVILRSVATKNLEASLKK